MAIDPNTGLPIADPGLINAPAQQPSYTPATAAPVAATATGYTPSPYTVTGNQTVQDQLDQIIAKDSPLLQRADVRSKQQMNERGLINSSTAVGAGQTAVIEAAMPIAQQDAATYNKAMTDTVNQQNAAAQFGAGATNTASLANAQAGTNVSLANAQAENKAFETTINNIAQYANTKLNTDTQLALGQLDATTKTALATLDVQNRQLLQSSSGASSAYVQAVQNIAAISQSNTMSQDAKNAAINTQVNMLRQQLQVIGGIAATEAAAVTELDLGQYFTPATTTGGGGQVVPGAAPSDGTFTTIPQGGYRLSNGSVYDGYGTLVSTNGPVGRPSSETSGAVAGGGAGGGGGGAPAGAPPKPTRNATRSDLEGYNRGKHGLWVYNNGWKWQP